MMVLYVKLRKKYDNSFASVCGLTTYDCPIKWIVITECGSVKDVYPVYLSMVIKYYKIFFDYPLVTQPFMLQKQYSERPINV